MCEDFPCCGHERGCCPDFDASGKQMNMVCICGTKLPIANGSSICGVCLQDMDDVVDTFDYEPDVDELQENQDFAHDDDFYNNTGGDFDEPADW